MELLERMAFWKMWDERNSAHDPFIAKCIDGKVMTAERFLRIEEAKEKEREAILKGFMPDGYYSAAELMEKYEKKSEKGPLKSSSAA